MMRLSTVITVFSLVVGNLNSFAGPQGDGGDAVQNSAVILYDFEDGTTQGLPNRSCNSKPNSCNEIVTDPVRLGNYALKFSLTGTLDSRSEVTLNSNIELDVDYWIGFSNYLLTWDDGSKNSVVYQTHRANSQPGSSPMVGLRATGSQWRLTQELDSPQSTTLWSDPIDENEWVDWVIHVKYTLSDDGIIELYKNGELVFTKTGRTVAIGTEAGPYDRFGIYHGVDETGTRELVYDEIRYFNSNSGTYEDVAPDQDSPIDTEPPAPPTNVQVQVIEGLD